jgi:hypothetical protein
VAGGLREVAETVVDEVVLFGRSSSKQQGLIFGFPTVLGFSGADSLLSYKWGLINPEHS